MCTAINNPRTVGFLLDGFPRSLDNLKGFAIFFNIQKFNNSFFDENFFLYFEEIDLCKKVKTKKGKIILSKNIKIKHEGSGSVDKNNTNELLTVENVSLKISDFLDNSNAKYEHDIPLC